MYGYKICTEIIPTNNVCDSSNNIQPSGILNIGGGNEFYVLETNNPYQLRTLTTPNPRVSLTQGIDTINLDVSTTTLTNQGTGEGIAAALVGNNYDIRSISGVNPIEVTSTATDILIGLVSPEDDPDFIGCFFTIDNSQIPIFNNLPPIGGSTQTEDIVWWWPGGPAPYTYNLGGIFDTVTNRVTIPEDGYYDFRVMFSIDTNGETNQVAGFGSLSRFTLRVFETIGNNLAFLHDDYIRNNLTELRHVSVGPYLSAGQEFRIEFSITIGVNGYSAPIFVNYAGSYLSIRKVR